MKYEFISADSHLDLRWLPKDLWTKRLAAKHREAGPQVKETPEGSFWFWEGKKRGESADGTNNEMCHKKSFYGLDLPKGSLPPSSPAMVLEHMETGGIYSNIFYGDTRKWGIQDPELRLEVYKAYNDHAKEMSDVSPERIIVLPNLPTWSPEACLPEFERVVKAGARGVEFGCYDTAKPIYDKAWDKLWAAAAEAGIPICCHIGDGAGVPYPPNERGSSLAHFSITPFALSRFMAQFVFSGVFERNPTLHVSFAECRIGWLPFFIEWMNRQVRERPKDPSAPLSMMPSEYMNRNCSFTFEEDPIAMHMLSHDWSHIRDCVIWGADYPHEQGTWVSPKKKMDPQFVGIDPTLKHEILFGRAARIFKIKGGQG